MHNFYLCKYRIIDVRVLEGSYLSHQQFSARLREFYYHKIGHWIGLDVHDDSPYTYKDEEIKFKENMIMTIEPGIYINESAPVDSKWKGIGIRIEDDILVTNKGPINLTNEVPSRSDEIEQLMS